MGKLQCSSCNQVEHKHLYTTKDYISQQKFNIEQCTNCGLVRTQDIPQKLNAYYGDLYYGTNGTRFFSILEKIIRLYRLGRAREVQRLKGTPGSILDIGCGRGIMLSILAHKGWSGYGTEIDDSLLKTLSSAEPKIQTINPNKTSIRQSITETIDIVTAFHVLEHVVDPLALLNEINSVQEENGVLIIEVPNLNSLQSILTKQKWFHLDAPRHINHFTYMTLKKLLSSAGYKTLSVSYHSIEYNYYGMLQSLLNLITSNINVLYSLLKPKHSNNLLRLDVLLSMLLFIPIACIAIPVEAFASGLGYGGVLHVVAKKL